MTTDAFPNGVASGDVTQTSVVLWTRSALPGAVTFRYTSQNDPQPQSVTVPVVDPSVPVKVEVSGLKPNTQYTYSATDGRGDTYSGQFRTPAAEGTQAGLRFGVFADWEGQLAPFSAIANAPSRDLDFMVLLGDTIYADVASPALPGIPIATTPEQFRIKHSEVYSERYGKNLFADLRASTPLYATWDDHEVINDFAGGAVIGKDTVRPLFVGDPGTYVNDTPFFDNGLNAFQDFNPLATKDWGETGDPRTTGELNLYRFNTFGSDAATFVLDTRSFRDVPLVAPAATATPEAVQAYLEATFNPERTLLGDVQLNQFKTDLLAAEQAGVTWKVVMSSVPMQNFGFATAGERWESYAAERADILRFIDENDIDNVVFVSADFHGNVVNNVTYQDTPNGPQIDTDVFDVMVGPVAFQISLPFLLPPFNQPFGAPYGPATVAFSFSPAVIAAYTALTTRDERDQFVKDFVNDQLASLGYSAIGLDDSTIDAERLLGDYINAHTFGWTEFDIDPVTQGLTISTYGIEPYTRGQLDADPATITARSPELINQIAVSPSGFTSLTGTDGNDTLEGQANDDRILALAGNDTVAGGLGDDTIFGGDGDDVLRGNLNQRSSQDSRAGGDDIIYGGNGSDRIGGKSGDDRLYGDAGDDVIWGDAGDDLIRGGQGNDVLTGDNASGGQGRDIFVLALGEGTDTITDFQVGSDVIGLAAGLSLSQLSFVGNQIVAGGDVLAVLNAVDTAALGSSAFVVA